MTCSNAFGVMCMARCVSSASRMNSCRAVCGELVQRREAHGP